MKPTLSIRGLSIIAPAALAVFLTAGRATQDAPARGRDAELIAAARDSSIVKVGKETYAGLCKSCHGEESVQGDSPSNLFDPKWYHAAKPAEIEAVIIKGILEKGMPGWGEVLPAEDVTAVTAYLLSFQKPATASAE